MIQAFIVKRIASSIIKNIMEKRSIKKMQEYVEEPNDADDRIDKLEVTVFQQGRLIEFMLNEKSKNKEKK